LVRANTQIGVGSHLLVFVPLPALRLWFGFACCHSILL
jgi:hypothetical protein